MKKLALAIGFGAYIVFGASGGTLAANRDDSTASRSAIRDSRVWSETGTNPQLLFVNQKLYPDTITSDAQTMFCTDGNCISR
jgi:hypothetical protein